MSGTASTTIILVVAIMAALVAWVVFWLSTHNNSPIRHLATQACDHECSLVDHNHDGSYAAVDHGHDDQYSSTDHVHDNDTNYAPLTHFHEEYVLRGEMDSRLELFERQVAHLRTMIIQSPLGILLGVLFGGLIGALCGGILDRYLPRSAFEVNATTTFNVNGRQIVQHLTSYDAWPMWGIPLGCAVAGMVLGGLVIWAVGMYRNRQSAN